MKHRVVISGIGAVTSLGVGREAIWAATLAGRSGIHEINRFDTSDYGSHFGGEIQSFDVGQYLPERLTRKLDVATHYALVAAELAITDGQVILNDMDRSRVGVYVGTCFGGAEFAEQQLRKFHVGGLRELSPFQATAWFPAATQGQISIRHGLRGESKTIMCDKASGLVSIGYAAQVVSNGRCDVMLAGGTEALITPYVYAACQTEGILAKPNHHVASESYRPFDVDRTGVVPAEGAAMILLESLDSAQRRGAKIYAEILGFEIATHSRYPGHEFGPHRGMAAAMHRIGMDSFRDSEPIDIVFADAIGTLEGDREESAAIVDVFGHGSTDVMVAAPKSMTGHMYGASGAMDTVWAAMTLAEQIAPPTVNLTRQDPECRITLTDIEARPRTLRRALINGRGHGGVGAAMALRVWNQSTAVV